MIGGAVHLPLLDHVHGLDAGNNNAGTPKRLELQYRSSDCLDCSVILLDDVVQVFVFAHQDINAGVGFHAFNGRSIGATLVDGDLAGSPPYGQYRHHLDSPAMHIGVVNENTAFANHLFNLTHAQQIVQPKEDLAQGANN